MARLALVAALVVSSTAFGADPKLCDKFIKAFQKAGKAVKQSPDATTLNVLKKQCGVQPDEQVKKDTACLEKVKKDEDMEACMR